MQRTWYVLNLVPNNELNALVRDVEISHSHWYLVIQYQRNEGPGNDNAQFRLNATIYDDEHININVPINGTVGQNNLVQVFKGTQVGMTSRLPSPLKISLGPNDDDLIQFNYVGNMPWDSGNSTHHCKFGGYKNGKREGDCDFRCD